MGGWIDRSFKGPKHADEVSMKARVCTWL